MLRKVAEDFGVPLWVIPAFFVMNGIFYWLLYDLVVVRDAFRLFAEVSAG